VGPIISGVNIIEVGSPINLIYGYESVGIFQDEESIANAPPQFGTLQVGNIQYKDQLTVDTDEDGIPDQADGVINPDDRVTLGNPFPRLNYGINLGAEYRGFDFAVSLQGVGKRDVLLGGDLVWPLYNAGKIQTWHVEEFWSPENPNAKFPKISATSSGSNDIQTSSTWVFDASYLRVRNVTFGYSLPKSLLNRAAITDLRIYVSGQNLFTFDNLPKGVDPLSPNNTQGSLYPITTNYNIGIDLKF
ncbi:MAG: SusC/RagA family TonB-linked outer membrane protein, partial [Bacteroidales bacterium]